MNITQGTHTDRCKQYSALIKPLNDNAENYYVWVERNGDVHVDVRGPSVPSNALFYCEAFIAGNGYVGAKASKDENYIDDEVKFLEEWWEYCNKHPSKKPQFADHSAPL